MARADRGFRTMPQKGATRRPETIATRWLREMVITKRDAAIRARTTPDGDTIRAAVAKEIRDALTGSDDAARERATVISAIALDRYLVDAAGDILRSERVEGRVGWHGKIVATDVAERASIPPRDGNGARVRKPGTYPLWLTIPRAEYFAKLADIDLGYARDGLRRALWHRGGALLRKHPSAANVTEACRLEGITVAAFLATP